MSCIYNKPAFPITVIFYENENEMKCDLEWFDSKDKDVVVKDSHGQLINLKIEALNLVVFELKNETV
ncbi:MAG: M55 family metallopeptidase [Campylobacteraceae bacterium]|nr:M55 family metallopeptidase [Campylobacteraceae bacterium]